MTRFVYYIAQSFTKEETRRVYARLNVNGCRFEQCELKPTTGIRTYNNIRGCMVERSEFFYFLFLLSVVNNVAQMGAINTIRTSKVGHDNRTLYTDEIILDSSTNNTKITKIPSKS